MPVYYIYEMVDLLKSQQCTRFPIPIIQALLQQIQSSSIKIAKVQDQDSHQYQSAKAQQLSSCIRPSDLTDNELVSGTDPEVDATIVLRYTSNPHWPV